MSAALSLAPLVKVCRCGAAYTAVEWKALPYCAPLPEGGPNGEMCEMRHCRCLSTIAVVLDQAGEPVTTH